MLTKDPFDTYMSVHREELKKEVERREKYGRGTPFDSRKKASAMKRQGWADFKKAREEKPAIGVPIPIELPAVPEEPIVPPPPEPHEIAPVFGRAKKRQMQEDKIVALKRAPNKELAKLPKGVKQKDMAAMGEALTTMARKVGNTRGPHPF